MNNQNLDSLFNPKSIVMIGASATLGKWGYIIFLNILKGNYQGNVYPINPKAESILGYKCYRSISEVPENIDMALITTPAQSVSLLIDECGEKGIKNIVVVTADFSEAGTEGAKLEEEIKQKAAKYGIRLVGPNTMGIFSAKCSLHALMPPVMPLHGNISMFSQSGNVGVQMLDYGLHENVGFEKFVSSGNEANLNVESYLSYFAEDRDTDVIIGYIEGVTENSKFISIAREISKKKPILVMKGGRTRAGGSAAASHSGAMAGSMNVFRAAFKQAGVIEASNTQELIDCAKAFSHFPILRGNRIGIITRGGGWGVLAADACEEAGLEVPPLADYLIKEMDKLLPRYWNRKNPVDLVATIASDPFPKCIEMMAEWDGIDAIIALGAGFQAFSYNFSDQLKGPKELMDTVGFMKGYFEDRGKHPNSTLKLIGDLTAQTGKPIISVTIGSDRSQKHYSKQYDVVAFPTPERAVRVLKHMYDYSRFLNSIG